MTHTLQGLRLQASENMNTGHNWPLGRTLDMLGLSNKHDKQGKENSNIKETCLYSNKTTKNQDMVVMRMYTTTEATMRSTKTK